MPITYPNESPDYRAARDALLSAELALRAKVEEVAALRRTLPAGGAVTTAYRFEDTTGAVGLADLFGDKDTLALYSFMYADSPCPMCTSMLDGLNGQARHIGQQVAFAVVAAADPRTLADFAAGRGWTDLRLVSAAGTTYQRDYHGETADGGQVPMMNVFQRRGARIDHFWGSEGFFADIDGHPRHIDQLWPLWQVFDLTPGGRGTDWYPSLDP